MYRPFVPARRWFVLAVFSVLTAACAAAQQPASAPATAPAATSPASQPDKRLVVRSFALNPYVAKLDGQWQGMHYASDGQVYFASSSHSHDHGAAYFRYNPRQQKLTMLCPDISRVCGEDSNKTIPQGKIHSDSVECQGRIFFATHLANYWDEAEAAYTGSHLVSLDMRRGAFRDWGILKERHTCYSGLAIDPQARWAYTLMVSWAPQDKKSGTFIVRTDLASGKMAQVAEIPRHISCHYLFADSRSDCWLPARGTLWVVRAADGRLDTINGALKAVPYLDANGERQTAEAVNWLWGQPIGDGERFLCTLSSKSDLRQTLYEFDARKANAGQVPFTPLARIGPTALGVAVAGDRVYFVRLGNGKAGPKGDNHHLLSAAWRGKDAGQVIDHGQIFDQDGRTPWRIEAMAADGEGKVFFSGDWYLLKDDEGNVLPSEQQRATLRLDERYDGTTEPEYTRLWRGQFFGVAEVKE